MEDMKGENLKLHTLSYVKPIVVSLVTYDVSSNKWGCLLVASNDEWHQWDPS